MTPAVAVIPFVGVGTRFSPYPEKLYPRRTHNEDRIDSEKIIDPYEEPPNYLQNKTLEALLFRGYLIDKNCGRRQQVLHSFPRNEAEYKDRITLVLNWKFSPDKAYEEIAPRCL
jgi:hypothetical protein